MEQIINELESEVSEFNNITTTSINKKKFSNTKKYESIMRMFDLLEKLWSYLHSDKKEYRHKSQIEETLRNIKKIFETMNDEDISCQLLYFLSICVKTMPTENINFHYEILLACVCSCSKLKLCIHYVLLNIVKPLTDEQCWTIFSRINHEVSEDCLKNLLNHPNILQDKERLLMNYGLEKLYIGNELNHNVYIKVKYLKENLGIMPTE
jgi:hypothetical protein